jgi:HK97 family phage major capsid protein
MTDMVVKTGGAEEVKQHLDTLKGLIKKSDDDAKALLLERDKRIDQLADEVKKFGGEFGDTKAKAEEAKAKFGEFLEFRTKAADAIDKLELKLKDFESKGTSKAKDEAHEVKEARHLGQLKHFGWMGDKAVPAFDEAKMANDVIEHAKLHNHAFGQYFRTPHFVDNNAAIMSLDVEHRKALSTFSFDSKAVSTASHGNQIWLPLTMTNRIERCFEEQTDIASLVSTQTISNAGMQFLRDVEEMQDAQWESEFSCNEKNLDLAQPQTTTIMAHALRATVCATNQMLDDAAFDLEGYIAQRAAEAFITARARGILSGTGNGMPHGGLKAGNHVEMESGNVAGTPSGDFSWQDLVAMKWKHAIRFHSGRSWWMDKDAAAATFTMADGEGRPIWSESSLAANISASGINGFSQQNASYGIPSLLGLPARIITQMPKYLDGAGAKVVGSKPIALGNWKAWYTLVERKGFSVLRDPFSKASCNSVVWHFYQRTGGDVLCPNAAMFLKIK